MRTSPALARIASSRPTTTTADSTHDDGRQHGIEHHRDLDAH